jgi:hypothetical protein
MVRNVPGLELHSLCAERIRENGECAEECLSVLGRRMEKLEKLLKDFLRYQKVVTKISQFGDGCRVVS